MIYLHFRHYRHSSTVHVGDLSDYASHATRVFAGPRIRF